MKRLITSFMLIALVALPGTAYTKEKITYAHLIDPSLEGLLYAA